MDNLMNMVLFYDFVPPYEQSQANTYVKHVIKQQQSGHRNFDNR